MKLSGREEQIFSKIVPLAASVVFDILLMETSPKAHMLFKEEATVKATVVDDLHNVNIWHTLGIELRSRKSNPTLSANGARTHSIIQ